MKEIKIRITFTEEALGTLPGNKEIYSEYIAALAPDAQTREEEIAAAGVEEYADKTLTVFARNPETKEISLFDYQMRGFFKENAGILKKMPDTVSSKIKAHKKLIDNYIFIKERYIPIKLNGDIGVCERPLRASTAQGERIALAMSETVPAGSTCEFTVQLAIEGDLKTVGKTGYIDALMEWLDYGQFKGFGQWRNSGKGKFTYEIIE